MSAVFRRLIDHAEWADRLVITALRALPEVPPDVLRECAHVIGAAEVWLARLEKRQPRAPIWPVLALPELDALARTVHTGYSKYVAAMDERALERAVAYTNSVGQSFDTPVQDILTHVALHGQYHRGKINLLLRQTGLSPIPTDYIAFVRGVPAARTIAR
jgi:uncharacterized damage-inducible protein DinB